MSLDSKIEYISKLLSINIVELKSINQEVIQQAYDYLISLKEFEDNDDITENQRSEVIASRNETKNQLETIIKENKDYIKRSSEHLDVQSGKSTIEIGQDSAPAPQIDSDERRKQIFEKSKKIILDHFLDLFYNFFITYEEKWKKASDDVKKKDYFRYLREKLADVIDENGTIQSLGSMSEDKK